MNYSNLKKHTTGPWIGLIHSTNKDIQIIGGHTIVAVVPTQFDEPWASANARLIAAAPDLLDVLVRASDALKVGNTRNVATDTYRDENELIHQIDAAIAKATEGP